MIVILDCSNCSTLGILKEKAAEMAAFSKLFKPISVYGAQA